MGTRVGAIVTVVLLVAASIALGVYRLDEAPVYVDHAEVDVALEARALATTGRSTTGEFLPLFVPTPAYPPGREPMSLYGTAVLFSVLPFSEWTLRLGSVIVAAVDVALTYLAARAIFTSDLTAIAASVLLMMSPAHLIYSRIGINALYPLPFVVTWLWCMARFLRRRRIWLACAAGISLGIGMYSHPSAVVIMPILVAATVLTMLKNRDQRSDALIAMLAFVLPLVCWAVWTLRHVDRLSALATHYKIYDGSRLNLLQGFRDVTSYFGLSVRVYAYWQYFSPSVLFFAGEPVGLNSARHVGLLPLPAALLFVAGLYQVVVRRSPIDRLLLVGLVCSTLAAALDPLLTVRRALVLLPFAVLIAAAGFQSLIAKPKWRYLAGLSLIVSLIQFQLFYGRYLRDPRMQSVGLFEEDLRGAFEDVIQRASASEVPAIVLSADIPFVSRHWEMHLAKHARSELLERTKILTSAEIDGGGVPAGSLIVRRAPAPMQPLIVIEKR